MKNIINITLVALLVIIGNNTFAQNTGIAYIENAQVNGLVFSWELHFERTNDWTPGLLTNALGSSSASFNYITLGLTNPSLVVEPGSPLDNTNYNVTVQIISDKCIVDIQWALNELAGTLPLNVKTKLLTVSMDITNVSLTAELSWDTNNTGFFDNADATVITTLTGSSNIPLSVVSSPTNLVAIADTFSVELSWTDNSDNETGFVIERKDGDSTSVNPYAIIDTIAANLTTYTDTGLEPNTTYTYRVFAYNEVGVSDYSNLAQTTTLGLNTFQLTISIGDGWNMVSVPGTNSTGMGVNTWWSGKDPAAGVFKYAGGYVEVFTTTPTEGYWMKNSGAQVYNYTDIQIVAHNPITAAAGWNLIGGYELSVLTANITTNPTGLQDGPVYEYSGGYQVATNLVPGYGYWIKLSGAGDILIPEVLAKGTKPVEYFKEDWGKIVLTDATGINYILYAVTGEVNLDNYELPPAPPTGMFDIRFSSGRIAEDINSSIQTIDMSGVKYPLTVRAEGMDIRLQDETGSTVNVNLRSGEDVVISDATIQKLMVTGELIPAVYALEQNYPNPFNPSTTIEFSLPEDVSNVKLSIYNALGERVAEIVNTSLVAGKYQYQWNAKNVATGMYIYELRTDKFVSVKKMVLLK